MATSSSFAGGSVKSNGRVYTRKLISRVYIDPFELDENFDKEAWYKKVYGPDVIVVGTKEVPDGWIMVDGMTSVSCSPSNI